MKPSSCTVLFRRTYRVGSAKTRLTLLHKEGCPFYTLLAGTGDPTGVCCARVVRLTTDEKFALFLIEKCREQKVSACHLKDILEDQYDRFAEEYERRGIRCAGILSE